MTAWKQTKKNTLLKSQVGRWPIKGIVCIKTSENVAEKPWKILSHATGFLQLDFGVPFKEKKIPNF